MKFLSKIFLSIFALILVSGLFSTGPSSARNKTTLAWGVHGVSDWTSAMAFIDLMHSSRPFQAHGKGKKKVRYEALMERGFLDAKGWPKRIPDGYERIVTLWDWKGFSPARVDRIGTYILTYEGTGDIEIRVKGANAKTSKGKIEFENPNGSSMQIWISKTDPKGTGDYIRNISLVKKDHLKLHQSGEIFNPKWMRLIENAQQLRFLNWMEGNSASIVEWKHRTTKDHSNWRVNGAPVEVLVELANRVGADPWFTIPHTVNDAYVKGFAEYVRKNLNNDLKAYVEFSNEHWNWGFKQFHDFAQGSRELWRKEAPSQYFAMRATQIALIWDSVFGKEADRRVVNVIGTHTANLGVTKQLLEPKVWKRKNQPSYTDPASVFDAVAVTTYFGGATVSKPKLRDELIEKISNPNVNASDWLRDKMLDPSYPKSIPKVVKQWEDTKRYVKKRGLKLLAYEGGQHIHHLAFLKGISEETALEVSNFLSKFTRSQQMAELYEVLWDEWAKVGDGPFMQFGDVGEPSKWGSFSAYSHLDDSNARSSYIKQRAAVEKQWW